MGPTQGPYMLQLCMGPSYFWRDLTPPDPPSFRTLQVRHRDMRTYQQLIDCLHQQACQSSCQQHTTMSVISLAK